MDRTSVSVHSFEELCLPLYDEMVGYARRLTGDKARADDVVQDSLEKAMSAWSRWQPDGNPALAARAWLFSIVLRTYLKLYHRTRVRTKAAFERAVDILAATYGDRSTAEQALTHSVAGDRPYRNKVGNSVAASRLAALPGDLQAILEGPFGDEVHEAVSSLSEDHRIVVHLHYVSDMSVADIALELGIPKCTVKTRLFRAREVLARTLGSYAKAEYRIKPTEPTVTSASHSAGEDRPVKAPKRPKAKASRVDRVVARHDKRSLADAGDIETPAYDLAALG